MCIVTTFSLKPPRNSPDRHVVVLRYTKILPQQTCYRSTKYHTQFQGYKASDTRVLPTSNSRCLPFSYLSF